MIHLCWKYLNYWLFFCITIMFWTPVYRLIVPSTLWLMISHLTSRTACCSKTKRGRHWIIPAAYLCIAVVVGVMIINVYWRFVCSFFLNYSQVTHLVMKLYITIDLTDALQLLKGSYIPAMLWTFKAALKHSFPIFGSTGQLSQKLVNFTPTLWWHCFFKKSVFGLYVKLS